jgi:cell division protein FtsZ
LVGYSDRVIINLDFADVSAVMKNAGHAHMGVGTASGKDKAEQAAMTAVSSPLLETSINGANGVLINITGSPEMALDEVELAAGIVMEAANPEANIIFGATYSEDFEDELRVTVIATGFEENKKKPENRGLFSAAASQKPVTNSEAPRGKSDADIDDIDKIFDLFRNK